MMPPHDLHSLRERLRPGMTLGILGAGPLADEARNVAGACGVERILLCDPQAAAEEAADMSEDFFALWGNGMGGCPLTGEGLVPYLPPESLAAADLVIVTLPPDAPDRDRLVKRLTDAGARTMQLLFLDANG